MIDHFLKTSLEKNIPISIMYMNEGGVTQRDIRVTEINDEFIKAYCYLRHHVRVFKRGSILSAYWCKFIKTV